MAQQGHNNPQQPAKQAPNREQEPRRAEPDTDPYRRPDQQKKSERDMPKRAGRQEEERDE